MATEGFAFGPSCIHCGPGLSGASVALVDGQNLQPQGSPLEENFLGGHI